MRKSLPANPNLKYLKKEAKELKQSVEQKNYSVSYRISEHLSTYQMGDPLTLSDAQFVIAREYGFTSWPKLKQVVNTPHHQVQTTQDASSTMSSLARVNITCGDIASTTLKKCGVDGQRLPWRDLLCIGPLPIYEDYQEFFLKRAEFIKAWTQLEGLPDAEKMARNDLQSLQDTMSSKAIIFWIWPHLSNQLLLLFLLDWYQKNNYKGELLWVDASAEPSRNDEEYVSSLLNTEKIFSKDQLINADQLWNALRQSTPEELISILNENNEYFPHLNDALWRYVEELPDSETGLSLQQRRVLEAIQDGCQTPHAIYKYAHQNETYFIAGDWSLWRVIGAMINAKHPLIETRDGEPFLYPPTDMSEGFDKQSLSLTKTGGKVLKAEISNVNLNGFDWHWGALKFSESKVWTYDNQDQNVKFTDQH